MWWAPEDRLFGVGPSTCDFPLTRIVQRHCGDSSPTLSHLSEGTVRNPHHTRIAARATQLGRASDTAEIARHGGDDSQSGPGLITCLLLPSPRSSTRFSPFIARPHSEISSSISRSWVQGSSWTLTGHSSLSRTFLTARRLVRRS